jgi:hypothetical protein
MSGTLLKAGLTFAVLVCAALTVLPAAAQGEGTPPEWYSNRHLLTTSKVLVTVWGELKLNSEAEGEIYCNNVMSGSIFNEGGRGKGALEGWGTNACKAPKLEQALNEAYGRLCELKKLKCPLTVFATGELPTEEERVEAEICSEESGQTEVSKCTNRETERVRETLIHRLRRRGSSFPWNIQLVSEEREGEPEQSVVQIGVPPSGQSCYPTEKIGEKEYTVSWEKVPAGCLKIDVVCPQIPVEVEFYGTFAPKIANGAGNGLDFSSLKFNSEAGLLVANKGEAPGTRASAKMPIVGTEGEQLIYAPAP